MVFSIDAEITLMKKSFETLKKEMVMKGEYILFSKIFDVHYDLHKWKFIHLLRVQNTPYLKY